MGMPGPQMVKRYGVELKLAAVAMSESPGVLVQVVAETLYMANSRVSCNTLPPRSNRGLPCY